MRERLYVCGRSWSLSLLGGRVGPWSRRHIAGGLLAHGLDDRKVVRPRSLDVDDIGVEDIGVALEGRGAELLEFG